MKRLPLLALALVAATAAHATKNIYDVNYAPIPSNFETLLADQPAKWDFRFRPYGIGASMLWTDPIVARDALAGAVSTDGSGPKPTALYVACDNESFSFIVLAVEPKFNAAIASTNAFPSSSIEFLFAPGDTDNHDAEPYFQFYHGGYGSGRFNHYNQWQVQDRKWRDILSSVRVDERRLPNGYLVKFSFPWEALFDRLPFSDKADAIWRLSVIRFSDGGRTWGGVVHEESRAGYIRFPDFTDAQKAKIMLGLLEKAWSKFNVAINDAAFSIAGGRNMPVVRTERYIAEQLATHPRSYILYAEDPEFRPVLERLIAERRALANDIARFGEMAPAEQLAFYRKASDMLFNFRYFVEDAYADYLEGKLFR